MSLSKTLTNLDAGIFERQTDEALKQVVLAALETMKAGELTLKIKVKPINESGQVNLETSLRHLKPRMKGKISEELNSVTTLFANTKGLLTIAPETKTDAFEGNVSPISRAK